MKWLLGGFLLWLAMKGRFGAYANLAASSASATPASTGASSAAPATSSGSDPGSSPGQALAGEIYMGGGSKRYPGSAAALPGMAQ